MEKVFIVSSDIDFQGRYSEVEWLPTSPTKEDPFYNFPKSPQDLVSYRMTVNKAVMAATRNMDKNKFVSGRHDRVAARNGISCAFRQCARVPINPPIRD